MTRFLQQTDPKAIGPGKYHEVTLKFEIPEEVTRVQVRLTIFSMGPRLGSNNTYDRDANGAQIVYYTWQCEPVDNVLAPEKTVDDSRRPCHVYVDRFVMKKKTPEGKQVPIERLVPIE